MVWNIRTFAGFFLAALFASPPALACSCFGTQSIGAALANAENVVVGRVIGSKAMPPQIKDEVTTIYVGDVVSVKVHEVLKGEAASEILISSDLFCFRSFNVDEFEAGETYVFAISHIAANGVHMLPSCSHTALMLADGKLYTNEPTPYDRRRLDFYMPFLLLKVLLPTGILNPRVHLPILGGLALLGAILATSRLRRRGPRGVGLQRAATLTEIVRSLRWQSVLAIAWLLLCAVFAIVLGRQEGDWMFWALGTIFAFAAVGVAFQWRWAEGCTYGLTLIWFVVCGAVTYEALEWHFTVKEKFEGAGKGMLIYLALVAASVAAMILAAAGVRRRFDGPAGRPDR